MRTPVSRCQTADTSGEWRMAVGWVELFARPNSGNPCSQLLGLVRTRPNLRIPLFAIRYSRPLVPAARLRPGFAIFLHSPQRGVGGAPTGARVHRHPSGLHMTRQARRLRSALRPSAEGRAPLGAPPWRFSASGPRFRLRHCLRRCVQRAPRSTGHSARRAVSAPPEPAVTSRSRGTPSLAPPSGLSPETPLIERGWRLLL